MARITSEQAVDAIGNRFDLVIVGAHRAKELKRGAMPRVAPGSSVVVTALREIEQGKYTRADFLKSFPGKKSK